MEFNGHLRALALAAMAPMGALAAASASVHVTGGADIDVSVAVSSNTANIDYQFFTVDLLPGETVQRTFNYTVTVADDGLPATRVDHICTPDYRSDCGPDPTGFELAYALIEIGRDRRSVSDNDVFIVDSNLVGTFQSVTGSPHTYTGTLVYTATDSSPFVPQTTTLQVMLFALADVAAVPEPSSGWLALLGIVPLLARRRPARRLPNLGFSLNRAP